MILIQLIIIAGIVTMWNQFPELYIVWFLLILTFIMRTIHIIKEKKQ